MRISELTRRDIVDAIAAERVRWWGRLEEAEFLSRLFDLSSLPSTDGRFSDTAGDIWQHRVNNYDWDDDWVFYDPRFNIYRGDDEVLLRFLCETIHPVVRPDVTEVERLRQMYNQILINDGFELVEKTRLSGKPVFVGRYVGVAAAPGVAAAKEVLSGTDLGYIAQQITRMEAAIQNDPGLAIGTAKELVETCCRTILADHDVVAPKDCSLPALVKLTVKQLSLTPDDVPDTGQGVRDDQATAEQLGDHYPGRC